jgi:hypothetical protein
MTPPRNNTNARRTRRLIVRLSDEDLAAIRTNAREASVSVSEYVRRVAVEGRIVRMQESGYGMALASQLKRVGNNLNQLMPIAHLNGELPPELAAVCRQLEAIFDRILRIE